MSPCKVLLLSVLGAPNLVGVAKLYFRLGTGENVRDNRLAMCGTQGVFLTLFGVWMTFFRANFFGPNRDSCG